MKYECYKQDWLGSKNIFYNTRTNEISDNINELLDPNYLEFSEEGFNNYLQYGYSVFGQTPIKEIKYLKHNEYIYKNTDGKMIVLQEEDPLEKNWGKESSAEQILEYMHFIVNDRINSNDDNIIVPTSGGFDSRLICSMIDKKNRINAFTYGISKVQSESLEVVYARKLCEILGIKWNEIELGDFNKLIDEWDALMGISTHSHGMYQMEFYSKIKKNMGLLDGCVISGIFGDIWAGSWDFPIIESPEQLDVLGKSYVEKIDPKFSKLKKEYNIRDEYYLKIKDKLNDRNWRVLEAGRTKIVLISYLLRVPEYYGFSAWSPFLDEYLISLMLNLDWKEKQRRKWQVDYFRKRDILIGEMGLECDKGNYSNNYAIIKNMPSQLNEKLLGTVIDERLVEWINGKIKEGEHNNIDYYYKYLVLYPIQKILELKEYGKDNIGAWRSLEGEK